MKLQQVCYYDASALVKFSINERGSDAVRQHYRKEGLLPRYTTHPCFDETLGVLKAKHNRKEITKEQYLDAVDYFITYRDEGDIEIEEVSTKDSRISEEVEEIMRRHSLDFSDAFQIVTVKRGYFSRELEMSPILITADKGLVKVARIEGLQVWDCMNEPAP